MLLADYARRWLQRRQVTGSGLKATTLSGYRRYIESDIAPSQLGGIRVSDVRRVHVNQFTAELAAAGRGAVTIRRITTLLGTIFAAAQRDDLCAGNPVAGADRPVLEDTTERAWEPGEIREFLGRCAHNRLGSVCELATYTGLRRGELCGLRWADIDFSARVINVRHNRVNAAGKVVEYGPKSRSGRRMVPLSDAAIACLLAWRLRQDEERAEAQEAWVGDGHCFTMPDGRPVDPSCLTRTFQVIRKQGEPLPPASLHSLRHAFASLALAAGGDIAVISKVLGHSSIVITSDRYSHLIASVGQQVVEGAASLIALTSHTQTGAET